jgi:hypothetical protein
MIRSGTLARFTPTEVEEFRQIGLDFSKVRHQDDIDEEVSQWAKTLADERFQTAYQKLAVTSRTQAVAVAERRGLLLREVVGASDAAQPRTNFRRLTNGAYNKRLSSVSRSLFQ